MRNLDVTARPLFKYEFHYSFFFHNYIHHQGCFIFKKFLILQLEGIINGRVSVTVQLKNNQSCIHICNSDQQLTLNMTPNSTTHVIGENAVQNHGSFFYLFKWCFITDFYINLIAAHSRFNIINTHASGSQVFDWTNEGCLYYLYLPLCDWINFIKNHMNSLKINDMSINSSWNQCSLCSDW